MVRMAFRHGLRVSELVGMRWSDLDLVRGTIYVRRLKGSKASTHYIQADVDLLLRVLAERATTHAVFVSERGTPMTAAGFRKQLRRWGDKAGIAFPVHPHQLRHACGYALANREMDTRSLQVYLGHSSIRHTVRYTEVSLTRFRGIWT